VYVNGEDGYVYGIDQGHSGVFTTPLHKRFLKLAIGAAYTPLSIGPDGRIYTQNDGHLFALCDRRASISARSCQRRGRHRAFHAQLA
jgi:hypothetical protein